MVELIEILRRIGERSCGGGLGIKVAAVQRWSRCSTRERSRGWLHCGEAIGLPNTKPKRWKIALNVLKPPPQRRGAAIHTNKSGLFVSPLRSRRRRRYLYIASLYHGIDENFIIYDEIHERIQSIEVHIFMIIKQLLYVSSVETMALVWWMNG